MFITKHNKEKNKVQYPRLLKANKPYSLRHHILSVSQIYDSQKVNKISLLTSSGFIFISLATSSQLL